MVSAPAEERRGLSTIFDLSTNRSSVRLINYIHTYTYILYTCPAPQFRKKNRHTTKLFSTEVRGELFLYVRFLKCCARNMCVLLGGD